MGTVGSSSWRHRRNIELELDRRWEKTQEQWTAKSDFIVAIPKRATYQFLKRRPKSRSRVTELWTEEVAQVERGTERCPGSDAARSLSCWSCAGPIKRHLLVCRTVLLGGRPMRSCLDLEMLANPSCQWSKPRPRQPLLWRWLCAMSGRPLAWKGIFEHCQKSGYSLVKDDVTYHAQWQLGTSW